MGWFNHQPNMILSRKFPFTVIRALIVNALDCDSEPFMVFLARLNQRKRGRNCENLPPPKIWIILVWLPKETDPQPGLDFVWFKRCFFCALDPTGFGFNHHHETHHHLGEDFCFGNTFLPKLLRFKFSQIRVENLTIKKSGISVTPSQLGSSSMVLIVTSGQYKSSLWVSPGRFNALRMVMLRVCAFFVGQNGWKFRVQG